MATNSIDNSKTINRYTRQVENEFKSTVQNINIDLSKIDMSVAIASFRQLEEVAKAADFAPFVAKIMTLQDAFVGFRKSVSGATGSVTTFANSSDKLTGGDTSVIQSVEFNAGDIGAQMGEISAGVGNMASSVSSTVSALGDSVSASADALSGSFSAIGNAAIDFGSGVATAADGVSGLIDSVTNLFVGFQSLGAGLVGAAAGVSLLIPLLPELGVSMLTMAVNMSGILAYLPELLIFLGVLTALSLLGEGLNAAGEGLVNVGVGLTSMTEGMSALLTFMPVFIASLAGITDNIGGIILFVLLAASILVMSIALQTLNEQLTSFVDNMQKLSGLISVGFVAAFVAFGAILIAMSMFMGKMANGMDKITSSMQKQATKLAVLNPLLATQAILTNPIIGGITVAAAVAGGLLVKALMPAMATGGVVSSPTVAVVGEGRYPEAVVPLGDSPQFSAMKSDIANAVVQGIAALGGMGGARGKERSAEVVLNVDGTKLARVIIPAINREQRRKGLALAFKES